MHLFKDRKDPIPLVLLFSCCVEREKNGVSRNLYKLKTHPEGQTLFLNNASQARAVRQVQYGFSSFFDSTWIYEEFFVTHFLELFRE